MPRMLIKEDLGPIVERQKIGIIDLLVYLILALLVFGVGSSTYLSMEAQGERNKIKSQACIKDFQELNCNPFAPNEQCKPLFVCATMGEKTLWVLGLELAKLIL